VAAGFWATLAGGQDAPPSEPRGGDNRSSVPSEHTRVPGSQTAESETSDLYGGLPWALAVHKTTDGNLCVAPGRLRDGQVVLPARGAPDITTSTAEAGFCNQVERLPDSAPLSFQVSFQFYDPSSGERRTTAFVWGVAKPGVNAVTVETQGNSTRIPIRRNSFLAVLSASELLDGARLVAERRDGQTAVVRYPPLPPEIRRMVVDPPSGAEIAAQHKGEAFR
jgi:hypothetical protein